MQLEDAHLVKGDPIEIGGRNASVVLRKVLTPKGERLAISSTDLGTEVFLDALNLESVTWQGPQTFADLARDAELPLPEQDVTGSVYPASQESSAGEATLTIGNEYTRVAVTIVESDAGASVLLTSENLGYAIRLGPPALAALTTSSNERFDGFLSTPFGPE